MTLRPAHRGYRYQDILVALHLAHAIVDNPSRILIDKKLFDRDDFDDYTVEGTSSSARIQIKHSENRNKPLEFADFHQSGELALYSLIRSFEKGREFSPCTLRATVTWKAPLERRLLDVLIPVDSLPGPISAFTRTFRFNATAVWPKSGNPVFTGFEGIEQDTFSQFCDHFVIECEAPSASLDLTSPGVIENLLLSFLSERIGIGAPPNRTSTPLDVAIRLVDFANINRDKDVQVSQILQHLQLKTDFGSIPQSFPIVEERFVDRVRIEQAIHNKRFVVLVGAPGSGKSWFLAHLVNSLREQGQAVTQHLCFVDPIDDLMEDRITIDTFFGNLVNEVIDSFPELEKKKSRLLAAERRDLEELLSALPPDKQITLIVDGLDHIPRVQAQLGHTTAQIEILDGLCGLRLPENVHVIVGCQPGQHVDKLRALGADIADIPSWDFQSTVALAKKMGIPLLMATEDKEAKERILEAINTKADGNVLYCTYMLQTLQARSSSFDIEAASELVKALPAYEGDLQKYYDYLINPLEHDGGPIVDIFGFVFFGISADELADVFSIAADRVTDYLAALHPVLVQIKGQGVRVYHESFRRYLHDRLEKRNQSAAVILKPVIAWLETLGFYENSRSFRYLLPTVQQTGNGDKVLSYMERDFVARSIAQFQPGTAIQRNIAVAAHVAAEANDWLTLVRLAEQNRMLSTAFEERLFDIEQFAETYLSVHPASNLVDRLLDNSKTTFPGYHGLLICSLLSDRGCIPPWQEYLQAYREEGDPNAAGIESLKDKVSIARVHGSLQLGNPDEIKLKILEFIFNQSQKDRADYCVDLINRVASQCGEILFEDFFAQSKARSINQAILSAVRLDRVQSLADAKKHDHAKSILGLFSVVDFSLLEFHTYLKLGYLSPSQVTQCPDLKTFSPVREHLFQDDTPAIRDWISAVGIMAFKEASKAREYSQSLPEDCWYHRWLRFVVELALLEATHHEGVSVSNEVIRTLKYLSADIQPFKGNPRVCDLYTIHGLIQDSLLRALFLLDDDSYMREALRILLAISDDTTTTMSREPGGPLTEDALVQLLFDCLRVSPFKSSLLLSMTQVSELVEKWKRFFDIQSLVEQNCIQAEAQFGESNKAAERWSRLCEKIVGYGYHKDITVFESVESLSSLADISKDLCRSSVVKLQPLVDSIVYHTDGKETRHAPIAWFEALCKCDATLAAAMIAEGLSEDGGDVDEWLEDGMSELLDGILLPENPLLLLSLRLLQSTSLSTALKQSVNELEALQFTLDEELRKTLLNLFQAKLLDECALLNGADIAEFREAMSNFLPETKIEAEHRFRVKTASGERHQEPPSVKDEPEARGFSQMSSVELESYCRRPGRFHAFEGQNQANSLGFRLLELLNDGKEDEVHRILDVLGSGYSGGSTFLYSELAAGFERYGFLKIATECSVYAFTRHRARLWTLGGQEALTVVAHSFEVAPTATKSLLSKEFARMVAAGGYTFGVGKGIIDVSSKLDDKITASGAWDELYEMLRLRLPGNNKVPSIFVPLGNVRQHASLTHALTALLFSRLNYPERKLKLRAATLLRIFSTLFPELVEYGLCFAMKQNFPCSSLTIILQIVSMLDRSTLTRFSINTILSLEQFAQSDHYSISHFASMILRKFNPSESYLPPEGPRLDFDATVANAYSRFAHELDVSNIAHCLDEHLPGFLPKVLSRFGNSFTRDSSAHKRFEKRAEAAFNRSDKVFVGDLYGWEHEIFELELNEELTNVYYSHWSKGLWSQKLERNVHQSLQGNTHVFLSLEMSRIARPALDAPLDLDDGAGSIPIFPACDFWISKWAIIAIEEIQRTSKADEKPTIRISAIDFGARSEEHGAIPLLDPLGRRSSSLIMLSSSEMILAPIYGPVVFAETVESRFGKATILSLESNLVMRLGLSPSGKMGPLTLVDEKGPAIRFCRWVGPLFPGHAGLDEEKPQFHGCCLAVRPDVMYQLASLSNRAAVMVTRIT